ncbi:MAG TPA: transcriptional regulator [Chloroflexi bacterium]|nr:transcriptional regulator [Chloroflexota bacterium]
MALQNRVRTARQAHGLTQEALARVTGVTRQTIIALEKGGYTPSVTLALRLADALEMTVEQLFWLERKGEAS